MALGFLLGLGLVGGAPSTARADGIGTTLESWFLTRDQRGRLDYEAGRYAEAAETFEDPMWKGTALADLGRYDEAAAVFAREPSADAAFAEGMARVKARQYRPGITAFEAALERNPDHVAAAHNLEITRAILAYLERVREESDTGSGSEGADEVVFDKESDRGTAQTVTAKDQIKIESAEQWMRTVDTQMSDFLSTRFALESVEDGS